MKDTIILNPDSTLKEGTCERLLCFRFKDLYLLPLKRVRMCRPPVLCAQHEPLDEHYCQWTTCDVVCLSVIFIFMVCMAPTVGPALLVQTVAFFLVAVGMEAWDNGESPVAAALRVGRRLGLEIFSTNDSR